MTEFFSKNKLMIKVVTIGILILLLLIPMTWIRNIIHEREYTRSEVQQEISFSWAGSQTLIGPVLRVPYYTFSEVKGETIKNLHYRYVLPETLNIKSQVDTRELRRGIYETTVFESVVDISGEFRPSDFLENEEGIEVAWNKATITIGISDLRGIQDSVNFHFGGNSYPVQPGTEVHFTHTGLTIPVSDIKSLDDYKFSVNLMLNGSEYFDFVPVGKITDITMESSWPHPSFYGSFLPDDKEISPDGFKASWKVLDLNRNYPQEWTGLFNGESMGTSEFGVRLLLDIDDYQKSIRSAKYAIMILSLTFLVFFLIEILGKVNVHVIQYTLIGLALCLFYILLVSISEHSSFNFAYFVSGAAVVILISLYSLTAFRHARQSLMLSLVMSLIYGFVFTTLQLKDYALLFGSIGLFITLALTMYFTRKIDWYKVGRGKEVSA